MNPNVTNKLPALYKVRTGIDTQKSKIHNPKGRF